MIFHPLHDNVLVKRLEPETTSVGGIIIPDTAKERPTRGVVVAVGPGARDERGERIPHDVEPGDHVLLGRRGGIEVVLEDVPHVMIREGDLLAVIGHRRPDPTSIPGGGRPSSE